MARRKSDPTVTEYLVYQHEDALKALRGRRMQVMADAATLAREIDDEIASIERARALLKGNGPQPKNGRKAKRSTARKRGEAQATNNTPRRTRDAHALAGKGNIAKVEKALAQKGTATSAEVRKATGKNSGTVTYAMRALVADGKARPTGRTIKRSPEFEYVAVARPGE